MLSLDSNRSAAEDYNNQAWLEVCYREIATSFATLDYLPYNILNKILRGPHTLYISLFWNNHEFTMEVSVKVKYAEQKLAWWRKIHAYWMHKLHKSVSTNLREYFAAETHDKASCAR